MDFFYNNLPDFLKDFGYYLMFPVMVIEGPVVTIVSSFYAKMGYFNIWLVYFLSVIGDMVGDVIFYALGYFSGDSFVKKYGHYVGIKQKTIERLKKYFENHGGKTVFIVKTIIGLCWATFATAGIVKMNFKKFLWFSFLGGIVWSGALVFLGYTYGYMWQEISDYIKWGRYISLFMVVLIIIAIQLYKKSKAKKIVEEKV